VVTLMKQKTDLRVVKTRKNIQDAFIRLLQQKSFERITIQNILDEALINRSTFYKHYQDKYELADTMIEELLNSFINALEDRFTGDIGSLPVLLKRFYDILFEKKDRILALLDVRTLNYHLSENIRKVLRDKYLEYMHSSDHQSDEREMSYQSEIYASIVMTSVKWLLELGDEEEVEYILLRSVKQIGKMIETITNLS
jgi:AcrR family transcriptional regulator